MSWGLGWKRPSDVFHLSLYYGSEEALDDQARSSLSPQGSSALALQDNNNSNNNNPEVGFRIDLEWNAGDDEDQVTLRLQSQVMVALPLPQDTVVIRLLECDDDSVERNEDGNAVVVEMKVVKQREPLRVVAMSRVVGSGQQNDGMGVLCKLLKSDFAAELAPGPAEGPRMETCGDHWMNVTVVSLNNCGLLVSSSFFSNF